MKSIQPTPLYLKRGAYWLAFLGPLFFLSYGWVNHFTSMRDDVGVVVQAWEHHLPFVPWLMLPYMSIDVFYAASLFMFRQRSALDRHALRLLLATVISLIGFLLFPLKFSFAIPRAEGFNGMLQTLLLSFDQPYNQAPSLHISLLMVLWVAYAQKLRGFARMALHVWFTAIAASVLLVYQHHFIDVWTGALAGLACLYLIPDKPFTWRWRVPSVTMQGFAFYYMACALLFVAIGLMGAGLLRVFFIWVGVALGLVALAYAGFEAQVFQRRRGIIAWPARLLLAPYLAASWLSYRLYLRKLAQTSLITEAVWIGTFPHVISGQHTPWFAVLDLSNEFCTSPVQATHKRFLPVMDLTPPRAATLVRAVRWLALMQAQNTSQQGILVHCALGLSRSAAVVMCWLVWRGLAPDIASAVQTVQSARKGVVLSAGHIAQIEQALKILRA